MLVIAAPSFDAPSETFIRDHVRNIAPGRTALAAFKEGLPEDFDGPEITGLRPGWKSPGSIYRRFIGGVRNTWGTRPGLAKSNRKRFEQFLGEIRPWAILAEYGPTGCHVMDICADMGIRLFVHFHGYDANVLPGASPIASHYPRLFDIAEGVVVTSDFLRDRLLALGCARGNCISVLAVSMSGALGRTG